MTIKEELAVLREKINETDDRMLSLFEERMDLSEKVADAKIRGNLSLTDEKREQEVVDTALSQVSASNRAEAAAFIRNLMALSKLKQRDELNAADVLSFPDSVERKAVKTAYQGVAGAWGEQSAMKMFKDTELHNFEYFEDVFEAVKNGEADYGVLPIENSQTGAIGEVYDLLRTYGCYITVQTWLPVTQCLLSNPGAELSGIREIFSHPQGFGQCHNFLKNRNWELTASRNTSVAAKTVAEKNDTRSAAIGSRRAAEIHGLSVLVPDIMDNKNNKTRFIAIAAQPFYTAESDIISITFSTAHKSGALCSVLEAFMLSDISLSRIESRPSSTVDRYRFFTDLQANIYDEVVLNALKQAAANCSYFEILGCYHNID